MVILNEKDLGLAPPPPYFAIEHTSQGSRNTFFIASSRSNSSLHLPSPSSSNPQSRSQNRPRRAPPLPSHVLLLIVYSTLPLPGEFRLDRASGVRRRESFEEMAVRTTRTLYWMAFCLRAVNRGFYLASMHILRSTFLPHYMQRVRTPYSSDPFPHTSVTPHQTSNAMTLGFVNARSGNSVVSSMQCESEVLDLYILHQLHEDVFADDTSLHTSRPERLRDLFDFMQPRARLTDLVRAYAARAGLVALSEEELVVDSEDACEDEEGYEEDGGEERDLAASDARSLTSTISEKRTPALGAGSGSGLNLKGKLARSTSTLTLINPIPSSSSSPSVYHNPSSSAYSYPSSPSASTIKLHPNTYAPSPSPLPRQRKIQKKILYSSLRVSFSPRRVGLVYTPTQAPSPSPSANDTNTGTPGASGGSVGNPSPSPSSSTPRTIVDIPRDRDEPLERSASRLVAGLKAWTDSVHRDRA